jgi:hypothetical protein
MSVKGRLPRSSVACKAGRAAFLAAILTAVVGFLVVMMPFIDAGLAPTLWLLKCCFSRHFAVGSSDAWAVLLYSPFTCFRIIAWVLLSVLWGCAALLVIYCISSRLSVAPASPSIHADGINASIICVAYLAVGGMLVTIMLHLVPMAQSRSAFYFGSRIAVMLHPEHSLTADHLSEQLGVRLVPATNPPYRLYCLDAMPMLSPCDGYGTYLLPCEAQDAIIIELAACDMYGRSRYVMIILKSSDSTGGECLAINGLANVSGSKGGVVTVVK